MHYADLTLMDDLPPKVIAIGWLDRSHPYTQGPVGEPFFSRLMELLVDPWQPAIMAGSHRCDLCLFSGGPGTVHFGSGSLQRSVRVGQTNLFVPAAT